MKPQVLLLTLCLGLLIAVQCSFASRERRQLRFPPAPPSQSAGSRAKGPPFVFRPRQDDSEEDSGFNRQQAPPARRPVAFRNTRPSPQFSGEDDDQSGQQFFSQGPRAPLQPPPPPPSPASRPRPAAANRFPVTSGNPKGGNSFFAKGGGGGDNALLEDQEKEEEESKPDRLTELLGTSKFGCQGKNLGYYADEALGCEVFHYCSDGVRHSWLCPAGQTFHQIHLICMPDGDNMCSQSQKFHFVNDYLYKPINEGSQQENDTLRYHDRFFPDEMEEVRQSQQQPRQQQHHQHQQAPPPPRQQQHRQQQPQQFVDPQFFRPSQQNFGGSSGQFSGRGASSPPSPQQSGGRLPQFVSANSGFSEGFQQRPQTQQQPSRANGAQRGSQSFRSRAPPPQAPHRDDPRSFLDYDDH